MSQTKTMITRRLKISVSRHSHASQESSLDIAIASLLSSPELREQFEMSSEKVAQMLNIADADLDAFMSIDTLELQRRADALLNKRWHEIRRLVPLTIDGLGAVANEVFRSYATNDWPVGHRRHPVDALRFLQFLIANGIHEPDLTELKRMRRVGSVGV